MKAIVTGGAGFIGSNLQDKLIDLGHKVAIIDNLKTGKKSNINSSAIFFQEDIRNNDGVRKIFDAFRPEAVFHLAAQSNVPDSQENPYEDLNINILGTLSILESCRLFEVKKIIYSNTGAFYGDVDESEFPIDEDCIVRKPTSFYGVSKSSAESYVKLFGNIFNLDWISLRYSNIYGPRQNGDGETGVVAIFTTKLLEGQTPTINGDGLHIRDYVYVSDAVDANLKALNFKGNGYFNISSGNQITTVQVFDAIENVIKTGLKPNYGSERIGDIRKISLSNKKAMNMLGWKPQTSFIKGIELTINSYLKKGQLT